MLKELHKKHYLLSIMLLLPPVHELGHVVIDLLIGQEIIEVDWFGYVRVAEFNGLNWINTLWEFSVFIPFILLTLFIWFNYKNIPQQEKEKKGVCLYRWI
jgi:hypothetical protein